jgi:hypothetical protein
MQLRTVWSDYFTGTPTSLEPNVYVKRQTPSGTSVYVSTVGLVPLHHQVQAVRCIAIIQLLIYLLSHPLSSLARQVIVKEEPFTFTILVVANVFYTKYVVMIVTQHAQVVRKVSLLTYMPTMAPWARIMLIIHQFYVVYIRVITHIIFWNFVMETFVYHQLIYH